SMIAITFKDGEPVRYFIDGEYEGDSAGNVAITDSGTTDLVIGNNNETNEPSPYPLKHVLLCNRPLTDEEIKCLYEESTSINSGLGPGVSQVYLMTTDTGSLTLTTRGAAGTGLWIDWGDGSGATWVSHTDVDTDTDTAHTYSGAGRKRITVTGRLSDVTHFRCSDSSLVNDISEFTGFTALQDLRVHGSGVTGDLSGIAGMTTLTRIQLNGSSVTGSIASLAALTNLTFVHAYGIAFTGNMSDLSPLTELETLYLHSTAVGVDTGALAPWDDATIWAQDCSWTATEVDDFLIYLDAAGGDDGTADVSGTNATRTSASNAAKTSLEGRGWTITANNPA
ncbi:MAG: hypothetical protein GY835_02585, partial [bacterium]|nr:hypothetical protein [bacterium]